MLTRSRQCVGRLPFYYGWILIGASVISIFYSGPGENFGIVVFLPFVMPDLKMDQEFVDAVYLVTSIIAGLASIPLGYTLEKFGAKKIVSIFTVVMSISCAVLALSVSRFMFVLGILGARLSGQSVLYVGNVTMISHWFHKYRGIALGVMGLFHQLLCVDAFPVAIAAIVKVGGWRVAYWSLAVFGIGFVLPMYLLLCYNSPFILGLKVDGTFSETDECSARMVEPLSRWGIVLSAYFWTFLLCNFCVSFTLAALQLHLRSMFSERNVEIGADSAVFLSLGVTLAIVEFANGLFSAKLSYWWGLGMAMISLLVTIVLGAYANNLWSAIVYGIFMGISGGAIKISTNLAWPSLFGLNRLGFVQGLSNFVSITGSALGPLTIGVLVRQTDGMHKTALLRLIPFVFVCTLPMGIRVLMRFLHVVTIRYLQSLMPISF